MHNKRPWLSLVITAACLAAGARVHAAGWGSHGSTAVLGQPLDFTVQMRLETGETLAPECVGAEVTLGERRLAAGAVRTAVEMVGAGLARVRVATLMVIDEPVVTVQLQAGCSGAVTRRFVVFADPAEFRTLAAAPAAYAPVQALRPLEVGAEERSAAGSAGAALAAALASTPVVVPAELARPVSDRPAARTAAPRRSAPPPQRRAERPAARARSSAAPAVADVARQAGRAVAAAAAAAPRLKLDFAEPLASVQAANVLDQAIEAVAEAASAARAAAAAASASAERIATLERTVDGLRQEARASRDLAAQLRQQLDRADDGGGRWTWPLLAAVLLLTALAAWLALRLNATQRSLRGDWRPAQRSMLPEDSHSAAADASPSRELTSPIPFVASEPRLPDTAPARQRGAPARAAAAPFAPLAGQSAAVSAPAVAPAAAPLPAQGPAQGPAQEPAPQFPYDTAMQRTEVLPMRASVEAARDVTVEELIDLEQQAEFFVVLGQEDAAVDLLVEHLRATGGGSPLPYLKLLEIYRRRGDRDDYERMRARFNRRFNAYAPEWDADLLAGRSLEDYAGVVPRLQQLWARPLDAMAELEALLFRKSTRGDLFDLPAYREVLFLYALARDLLDRDAVDPGNVDLLLPIADGGEFSSTGPAPFLGLERSADSSFGDSQFDERLTAPVDFDLSADLDRPTSIFDTLDAVAEPPRRR